MSDHKEGCMCDKCITLRTKTKVERREIDKAANAYISRRGGEPKRGDLQDALKSRK